MCHPGELQEMFGTIGYTNWAQVVVAYGEVSRNGGTQKKLFFKGKCHKNKDDLEVPQFQETPI